MFRTFRAAAVAAVAGALWVAAAVGSAWADSLPDGGRLGDLIVHRETASHVPLAGVTFAVARVSGIDPTTADGQQAAGRLTATSAVAAPLEAAQTLVTDARGIAKFNDLPVGIYLVAETAGPAGVLRSDPFLVSLPMTDPAGRSTWQTYTDPTDGQTNYLVDAYPKGETIKVTKAVSDADAVTSADEVIWTITASVPKAPIKSLSLSDDLDPRLDYVAAEPVGGAMTVHGADATQPGDHLSFVFDPATLTAGGTVEVRLRTRVVAGRVGQIPNEASLTVDNSATSKSNTVLTSWGTIAIEKTDEKTGDLLIGATFKLGWTTKGGDPQHLTFAKDPDDPTKDWTVTTDQRGHASFTTVRAEDWFDGHAASNREYYLVETEAPTGYTRFESPIRVALTGAGVLARITNVREQDERGDEDDNGGANPVLGDGTGPGLPSWLPITAAVGLGAVVLFVVVARRRDDAAEG